MLHFNGALIENDAMLDHGHWEFERGRFWKTSSWRRSSFPELTSAQRRSTASNTSSWCPIRVTPSSSRSWWEICSSCSPFIFSRSNLWTYCCRQSSNPTKKSRSPLLSLCYLYSKHCSHLNQPQESPIMFQLFDCLYNVYPTWWTLFRCVVILSSQTDLQCAA